MFFDAARRARRRRRWLQEGLEPAQVGKLAHLPFWARLGDSERSRLSGWARVFEESKRWEGRDGLRLTEDIKAVVAAQACRIVLRLLPEGPHVEPYDHVHTICLHPSSFRAPETRAWRQGEAWHDGRVVLAWDHAYQGGRQPDDGHNVVIHEFAHQLDMADGEADGFLSLFSPQQRARLRRVLGAEQARLRDDVARGRATVLDPYGATDPAEFFAVASEHFFETPGPLRAAHPELYAALAGFYRQDPA